MQICMPVVPKFFFKNVFPFFLVKWVYHKLYILQFQIFYTNWPSLTYTQRLLNSAPTTLSKAHWQESVLQSRTIFPQLRLQTFFYSSSYKKKIIYFYTLLQVGSTSTIYYTKVCTVYNEKWTSLNHFVFHLPKKGPGADPKKSAPAPDQIFSSGSG